MSNFLCCLISGTIEGQLGTVLTNLIAEYDEVRNHLIFNIYMYFSWRIKFVQAVGTVSAYLKKKSLCVIKNVLFLLVGNLMFVCSLITKSEVLKCVYSQ